MNKITFAGTFKTHFLFCVLCFTFYNAPAQSLTTSQQGIYSLTGHNFAAQNISLSGNWFFFEGALLSLPECIRKKNHQTKVLGIWNDHSISKNGQGYGTYFTQLIIKDSTREWGIYMPQLYNSYLLYINDSLIAYNGKVGTSVQTTTPQWKPQVAGFSLKRDTISIVLQIANFHHYKGGYANRFTSAITTR